MIMKTTKPTSKGMLAIEAARQQKAKTAKPVKIRELATTAAPRRQKTINK